MRSKTHLITPNLCNRSNRRSGLARQPDETRLEPCKHPHQVLSVGLELLLLLLHPLALEVERLFLGNLGRREVEELVGVVLTSELSFCSRRGNKGGTV